MSGMNIIMKFVHMVKIIKPIENFFKTIEIISISEEISGIGTASTTEQGKGFGTLH